MTPDDFNIKYSDLKPLSGIFKNTTTSYKFLFFLSLLDIIKNKKNEAPVTFDKVVAGMLYWAWYPHSQHRLSFGKSDRITSILSEFEKGPGGNIKPKDAKKAIRTFLKDNPTHVTELMKFVPYRLIRPFAGEELAGVQGTQLHSAVQEMSAQYLYEKAYPYTPSREMKTLIFNRYWLHYFKSHFHILQGWASWHWVQYMQKRNPSVPAIPAKIIPQIDRPQIDLWIRECWLDFWGQQEGLLCIFSKREITTDHFALDHFLPWNFVAHHQMWNLSPIDPDTNSSKSDKIPDMEMFLKPFVKQQYKFLSFLNATRPEEKFGELTESYVLDLGMSRADLLDERQLLNSYQSYLEPLASLALKQGFQPFQPFAATQ